MNVRTALVGFGYAGQTFHAPLIAASVGLDLSAIVSGQADKVAARWPAVPVRGLEEVLADPGIDLIVIATPNDTHADLARRGLQAGKHVVVDKPFTVELADARDLAALGKATGRVLSIFHNRRWDADFLTLADLIGRGQLGRITQFESHFDRFRPVPRDRWRERSGVAGGGLWYDLGPHLIDQALCLFGRPQSIQADIATQRPGGGAPDYFHAILAYADGLRVILHGSMLTPDSCLRFAVHGDGGSFIKHGLDSQEEALKAGMMPGSIGWGIDPKPGTLTWVSDGEIFSGLQTGIPGDYLSYYAAIAAAIRQEAPNPVPADDAVAVMKLISMGLESAEQGRTLVL